MVHHVIYIPGIGDTKTTFQELAVKTWRLWGVVPHAFALRWADGKAYVTKEQRLLDLIDELYEKGHTISLVGASAGAGAVINAFAARRDKISGVVCLCGKIYSPQAIGTSLRRKNPAFVDSAYAVEASLAALESAERSRIMSRYAMFDSVVPRRDSVVPEAINVKLITSGHSLTIASQLLFGAPFFIRFLKRFPPK